MTNPHPRRPPSRDTLTHFLSGPRELRSVNEIATLLGWTRARVKRQAVADDELLRGHLMNWRVAARWLFDVHALRSVFDVIGTDTSLLPKGLQLLTVQWQVPAYIVHAFRIQARHEALAHRVAPPAEFNDYLWDVLHRAIDGDTVTRLRADREFMAAYEFPDGEIDG